MTNIMNPSTHRPGRSGILDALERHLGMPARDEDIACSQCIRGDPAFADDPPRVLVGRLDRPPPHPQRHQTARAGRQVHDTLDGVRRLAVVLRAGDDRVADAEGLSAAAALASRNLI